MADYVEVPDFTTGDTVTADNLDTYLRNNFKAVFDGPVAGEVVRMNAAGNAFESAGFAALVKKRQGGSASDWDTEGSTNYTPTSVKIQTGVVKISISTYTAYADITFPEAFTNKPTVFTALGKLNTGGYSNTQSFNVYADGITNTGCRINLEYSASSVTCGRNIHWIAIGE